MYSLVVLPLKNKNTETQREDVFFSYDVIVPVIIPI